MKISGITVYEVKPRWIFVKITTDEGIEGWGEMISGTKTETVVAGAKEMGEYLLGRDPFEIERLWQEMYKSFFRGGPINGTIVSGMEMALWDIKGKAFGVPVYEFLGGKARDRIKVYSWIGGDRPDDVAKAALERRALGFDAVKRNCTTLTPLPRSRPLWTVLPPSARPVAMISASLSTSTAVCISRWPRCWPMNWSPTS